MKNWHWLWMALASMATAASAWAADTLPSPAPTPRAVAPDVWMIPGGMRRDRQPDGNSVVFDAPAGLIVVDSGRHAWHRDAILDLARAQKKKVIAIVNTHWHLDHVSGNPALRAAYPDLRVYASDAIDGALTGFLAKSVSDSAAYLEDSTIAADMRDDIRGDVATIQAGQALRPDTVIAASGPVMLGGRELTINLARDAVTAGDVWAYDEKNRLAVLGDLVTLPAPFLDTACPAGWKSALQQVAATNFEVAIPGHGDPMNREQFLLYQDAFDAFIGCANSARPQQECATQWTDSVQSLLSRDPRERPLAMGLANFYIGMLRDQGGHSQYCESAARVP